MPQDGEIAFKGQAGQKMYVFRETTAGEVEIYNETDGIVVLEADATSIRDAGGVQLSSHGSRHVRGGADGINDPNISNLADSGDVSCTVGLNGVNARTTVYTPPTNFNAVIPQAIYMEVGGTVAAGETVTISVKTVLDDASEYEIATFNLTGATGNTTESNPFTNLLTNVRAAASNINQRRITSIVADVNTSAASTTATVVVRAVGVVT